MTFDGKPYYGNKPHFTSEPPNQWFEKGYFLFEGKVFPYQDDRSANYYHVGEPISIEAFLSFTEDQNIEIPEEFLKAMEL